MGEMNKIILKHRLSDNVFHFKIAASAIAEKRRAGQFIILRPGEDSERIPLTIADANVADGTIDIVFQVVGYTTSVLSQLGEGDLIHDLVGPLGTPTHIEKFGNCLCVAGGIGAAPIYPIVDSLKHAGNNVTSIIGARNKNLLIFEKKIASRSDDFFVATDDGSNGHHGFVSDVILELLANGQKFDFAMVIGPPIMMKVASKITVDAGIKTYASLNPIMIDGTGMCGCCRVSVGGKTKFACVDGPEFDAAQIDWDELFSRLNTYVEFEKDIVAKHQCKLAGHVE